MIGKSYPGITQLFVAAQQPAGPGRHRPGPLLRRRLPRRRPPRRHRQLRLRVAVELHRPAQLRGRRASPCEVAEGDAGCLRGLHRRDRSACRPTRTSSSSSTRTTTPLFDERSPETHFEALLDIPMLATLVWQDEQLASRQTHLLVHARRPRGHAAGGPPSPTATTAWPARPRSWPTSSGSTTTSSRARTTAGSSGPACRCGGTAGAMARERRAGSPASTTGRRPPAKRRAGSNPGPCPCAAAVV